MRVVRREGPDASMDRFAAEAGVTKPILYRAFGDRAGLHQAVGEHVFATLGDQLRAALAQVDVSPRQMVTNAIDAYIGFIEREPALYAFLTTVAARGTRRQTVDVYAARATSQVARVLGEALRGLGRDSGAAEPWAYGIVGMVVMAGGWWLERQTMPRARLVSYLSDLVCDGLPGTAVGAGTVADLVGATGDVRPVDPPSPGDDRPGRPARRPR